MSKAHILVELSNIQKIADSGAEDVLEDLGDFSYSNFVEISEKIERLKQKIIEEPEE